MEKVHGKLTIMQDRKAAPERRHYQKWRETWVETGDTAGLAVAADT